MTSYTQVTDVVPRAHYAANGVQTAFPFTFPVFDAEDMDVWIDQQRQSPAAYSVSGIGVAVGGTVIFTVPPPPNTQVTLRRRMALKRTAEFPDTAVEAKPLNDALYYQMAALQQVADDSALAVKRSFRSLSCADLTLPEPVAGRAIRWNDSGDGLVNSADDADTVLSQAAVQAQAASAAAAQALASSTAAAAARSAAETARQTCDADVVVTGADRAAVAIDRTGVASDRVAIATDRLVAEAAAAAAASSQAEAGDSRDAAATCQINAAASEANAGSAAAIAGAAASAAAASQSAAHVSELSAAGSASAAAVSAIQAQAAAGLYTFTSVVVAGQGTITADRAGDTLTLAAGANLGLASDPATDTVTIAVTGLATVATSGAYADLSGKPSLGSAAGLDVGTTANKVVQLDGAAKLPVLDGSQLINLAVPGGVIRRQIFTASGTFTIPAGATSSTAFKITIQGGGGGGGGTLAAGNSSGPAGGGGGGYAEKLLTGFSAGKTITVTVGAGGSAAGDANGGSGGASSISSGTATISTVTANGGGGGAKSSTGSAATPGAGGTATGGDVNISGQTGCAGFPATYGQARGGSSMFGLGGAPGQVGTSSAGNAGTGYGAGGGSASGGASTAGGPGAPGLIIIEWVL